MDQTAELSLYRDRVLRTLRELPGASERDHRDRSPQQLVRLVHLLVKQGDKDAQQVLRDLFVREPGGFPDAGVFVEQDGLEGLIFVARTLGQELLDGGIDCHDESISDVEYAADEALGDGAAWASVLEVSGPEPSVKA